MQIGHDEKSEKSTSSKSLFSHSLERVTFSHVEVLSFYQVSFIRCSDLNKYLEATLFCWL